MIESETLYNLSKYSAILLQKIKKIYNFFAAKQG
jgi:hypothetical protein